MARARRSTGDGTLGLTQFEEASRVGGSDQTAFAAAA
jgi:hypothetical protein